MTVFMELVFNAGSFQQMLLNVPFNPVCPSAESSLLAVSKQARTVLLGRYR